MAVSKIKALQTWCKNRTDGYKDVAVRDMTKSFRNGLAFCAIIHRFRPDLIDFASLSKENVFENNKLAFDVAEKELGIPALLDASDMLVLEVPDKLSIITYVSQYHNHFKDLPQLGGPGVQGKPLKRSTENGSNLAGAKHFKSNQAISNQTKHNGQVKSTADGQKVGTLGDKCDICDGKVYLLERHLENGKLYHRSCFKRSELSPTSKVFKDQNKVRYSDKMHVDSNSNRHDNIATRNGRNTETARQILFTDAENNNKPNVLHNSPFSTNKKENNHTQITPSAKLKTPDNKQTGVNVTKTIIDDINSAKTRDANADGRSQSKIITEPYSVNLKKIDRPVTMFDNVSSKRDFSNSYSKNENISSSKQTATPGIFNNFGSPLSNATDIKPRPRNLPLVFTEQINKSEEQSVSNRPSTPHFNARDLKKPETSPSCEKESLKDAYAKVVGKHDYSSKENKISFQNSPSPKAKLRHNLQNEKPVPTQTQIPKPALRNIKNKDKVLDIRPKTPPLNRKTVFTKVDISTNSSPEDQIPPPLPRSQPPQSKRTFSPPVSPRISTAKVISGYSESNSEKSSSNKVTTNTSCVPPTKPPRVLESHSSTTSSDNVFKSPLPKDSKPVVPPSPKDSQRPLVSPTDTGSDKQVLSGLLKSLAGVRERANSSQDSHTENNMKNESSSPIVKPRYIRDIPTNDQMETVPKSKICDNLLPTQTVNEHAGYKSKLNQNETNSTVQHKFNQPEDIPTWKEALQNRTENRDKPRPKSAVSPQPEKKPEWQHEAEKRQAARKGHYVDPETKFEITKDTNRAKDLSNNSAATNFKNQNASNSRTNEMFSYENRNIKTNISDAEHMFNNSDKTQPNNAIRGLQKFNMNSDVKTNRPDHSHLQLPDRKKISPPKIEVPPQKRKVEFGEKINFEASTDFDNISKNEKASPPKISYSSRTPERPPPPQVHKKRLTPQDLQRELCDIDSKLTRLELRGRKLEDSIRYADTAEEEDDLMGKWFTLVSDKNELVRKEADIIYISREQDLEDEQENVDQQLRHLMNIPDHHKSPEDKKKEAALMNKLLTVVNQRNHIVDSIDEDRLRYEEEDQKIAEMIENKVYAHDASPEHVMKDQVKKKKQKK